MPNTTVTVTAGMPTTVTVTGGVADVTIDVLRGATGATGAAGPNTVTTSTTTNITGIIKGNGSVVSQAISGTDYAAALGANDNYVTDAQLVVIGNTSGTNTGDQFTSVTSQRLIGRHAGSSGAAQEVQVGDGLEFSGSGIRRSALTGDITASAGSNATTLASTIAGAKTLSGQLELTGQAATTANSAMTRGLADKNIMFNVAKVRILPAANMTYNTTGAGTTAISNIDGSTLTGGVAASAFTRAALTRQWTTFPGITGVNNACSVPVAFAFQGVFYVPVINTVFRFIVGDAGSGAPALPSANAISGRGFGFEIFFDSVPKIRLFAHDGTTYTTSAAVNSGTSFDVITSLLIASDGVGNLKLFIANSTSIAQRIPETATLTHTGAPTSGAYTASHASILTANDTTAPLSQALVRVSQAIIHINQLY